MAIPFFILAGELMFHGGIAMRLVRFAQATVGAARVGIGVVNVFSSMLFGGISGPAIADVSALGSFPVPAMNAPGIDPLQFGMILLVNLGPGLCTSRRHLSV